MSRFNVKSVLTISAVMLGLSVSTAVFAAASPKTILATVGNENITVADLDERIKSFPQEYAATFQQKEAKVRLLDQIIDEKILLAAAKKKGISKTEEFKKQIDNAQNQILFAIYIRDNIDKNVNVTDEELKQFFDKNPQQFQEVEQRRAKHILVKTEEEAKAIQAQLKAGADFAQLAKDKSIDPSAKTNSGDLGWFSKGQMVPEFETEAFKLKKGELSGIVKTQFGFHIIKLDDINVRAKLEFEQVKTQIRDLLVNEKRRALTVQNIDDLKKSVKIKKDTAKID